MKTKSNDSKFTKDNLLELKKERLIYQFILKNQGIHFRELVRKLKFPQSTLIYYLNCLVKQEFLIVKKDDRYARYFTSKNLGDKEKKIISIIRNETTRNVLLYIMAWATASQIEIADELDKHPTTINFHLKRLLKHDIIEPTPMVNGIVYPELNNDLIIMREKSKNEISYRIKEPEIIKKLFNLYYLKGYYNDIIAEVIFSSPEFTIPSNHSKVLKTTKETIELIENLLYDVFPHPYYT